MRHWPLREQHRWLSAILRGHYSYYGITANSRALSRYRYVAERLWHKWLNRRSQKRSMSWERFEGMRTHYSLPRPRIVHSHIT